MAKDATNFVENPTDEEWETVAEPFAPTMKWDSEGQVLQGTYKGSKQVEGTGLDGNPRTANVYEIQDSSGNDHAVWGTYALDAAFADIVAGQQVRITFHGKEPINNGAQTVNKFTVQVRK